MEFGINYDPYNNNIHFWEDGKELPDGSSFLQFQQKKVIFQNCVEEIIKLINQYENISSKGVDINFEGTKEDYSILCDAINRDVNSDSKSKRLKVHHRKKYESPYDTIRIIRECYEQIEKEFEPYIARENDIIGCAVLKFRETVKPEIPVCVIGNYSVGKSAFINALIGREVLPSKNKASTAKNVIIRNSDDYSVTICKKTNDDLRYIFRINPNGQIDVNVVNGSANDSIVKMIKCDLEDYHSPDEVLYKILDNINSLGIAEEQSINETIEIKIPFHSSILEQEDYQFAFIDTPGSNNVEIDQEAHLVNLKKILSEQTNALPIFVTERSQLTGNDNDELKKLLDNYEDGFSIQNQIIVIAKADSLVKSDLEEEVPNLINQWSITPTIMYVSQVIGIGEKKEDKEQWLQEGYKERYTQNTIESVLRLNAPSYNKTPCDRNIPEERKNELSKELIASGIPHVESEILYFARTYADYKKSVNGRIFLMDALSRADAELRRKKDALEEDKSKQKEDQDKKRLEIKKSVNSINYEFVNIVIEDTKVKYKEILDAFILEAGKEAKSYWEKIMSEKDAKDKLIAHMKSFGQDELYGKNCKRIDKDVREKYMERWEMYRVNVENCIMQHKKLLSNTAFKKLSDIFESGSNAPKLNEVEPKGFDGIKLTIKAILSKKEKFVDLYLEYYSKQLKGDKYKIGLFYADCIQTPAIKYSNQIKKERTKYLSIIDGELDKPGSILSAFDDKIKEDEEQIKDLEDRLSRLGSVREKLESLLDLKEV